MPSYKKEINHLVDLFNCDHLPFDSQEVVRPFKELASHIYRRILPANEPDDMESGDPLHQFEAVAGLRKLLEAKDCIVRAHVARKYGA